MTHLEPRRTALPVLVAVAAVLVSACGPVLGGAEAEEELSSGFAVPSVSSVEAAADPRAFEGVIDIDLPDPVIDPVTTDAAPRLPVTVTDSRGERVTVSDTDRVLALDIHGTLAQTVFELGLGDQVVGRDVSSSFPGIEDRPLVTRDGHDLNAEAILALEPTVVLTDTSLGPFNVVLQLEDAGIPVVVVDSERNLENLAPLTMEVATALGVPGAGRELGARIEQETADVTEAIAEVVPDDVTGQLRTVFLYVRGQAGVYYMFGEGSGADSLITAAGGYDVAEEIGWAGMKPVNDEGLVAAQPDVVLMMTKGLESVGGVDGLLERFPALAATEAGRHERIVAMDDAQVLSFGPRTPEVLNALAVALYAPDAL
ncbi:heme/hemin ABC transporter substrate-binding protein [Nocardioides sp. AX2bis]|uniref:heme/hemin ABC transporter substrate-binding protein n=1 Tax=Nocardioides sp. AX2bis TaxID=2653157 RepID=UPI0012F19D6F|nr:ABC transporter substrate-binding protein [Nocardioides sp. AX2bis]VXB10505.1 Heme ABC transporter, cell surface heme and hemoprotein receptor HmuT [Nocardioides sp. AX2bis]